MERISDAKNSNSPGYNYSIVYHSDETLGISHDTYKDLQKEKLARGAQISAVKRDLSRSNFVILDSLAYIKGFRYQLFCEAKGLQTPHCVIHVMNPTEKCIEWNNSSDEGSRWDDDVIRQLAMRYEEPNSDTRWDLPLFTVVSDYEKEVLPVDEIWDALVLKRPPPPNAATVVKATSGNDFLQELDKQTLAVVSKVTQHQQIVSTGGDVLIDKEGGLYVELPLNSVSLAQLQRIRRTFIGLNRMRTVDVERITALFVEYMNGSLNND